MPRSIDDILAHADELAKRFEEYEPMPGDERDPEVHAALRTAVISRASVERDVLISVQAAREAGYSWSLIGSLLGTSGEAARLRYGKKSA
jgi:hypothetical protein